MKIIEVEQLIKKYKSFTAVNGVSLSVEEGQIYGLLGPNGAGKTTTIECIIGLKKLDGGSIKVLGLDPSVDQEKINQLIGVQLQETSYQDKVKVHELCELFSTFYENPLDYHALLQRFGLEEKKNAYINKLSGGQKQKISIILALISNPKLLFLDELTTGLDPKSRRELWDYIKELKNEGRTIFMTTHYMEEASYLCDKIAIIDNGKIMTTGTVEEVIAKAELDYTITFESEEDVSEHLKSLGPVHSIERLGQKTMIASNEESLITDLILLLREKGIHYRKLDIRHPGLEDAFIKLTGRAWKGE